LVILAPLERVGPWLPAVDPDVQGLLEKIIFSVPWPPDGRFGFGSWLLLEPSAVSMGPAGPLREVDLTGVEIN
jgi:hypothetical protein